MKPTSALSVVKNPPVTENPDALMGAQLDAQFERANGAMREVILFGAMMLRVRENLSARGQVSKGGRGNKDGFADWLRTHSPQADASRSTAYRFMALAEGVRDEFKLGKKADLALLLTSPDEELSEKMRAQQRKILDLIEGKSQRQLLLELGGESKLRGGRREKTTPEETPEQRTARETAALREKFALRVFGVHCLTTDAIWGVMEDIEIERAIDTADEFLFAARAYLATPKSQRAALALEN